MILFFAGIFVGVFVGFWILALLTVSHDSDEESEIIWLRMQLNKVEGKNKLYRKRIKNLSDENAKLFTENMKLRRGKVEVEN